MIKVPTLVPVHNHNAISSEFVGDLGNLVLVNILPMSESRKLGLKKNTACQLVFVGGDCRGRFKMAVRYGRGI
jgi:hypothetical protein